MWKRFPTDCRSEVRPRRIASVGDDVRADPHLLSCAASPATQAAKPAERLAGRGPFAASAANLQQIATFLRGNPRFSISRAAKSAAHLQHKSVAHPL